MKGTTAIFVLRLFRLILYIYTYKHYVLIHTCNIICMQVHCMYMHIVVRFKHAVAYRVHLGGTWRLAHISTTVGLSNAPVGSFEEGNIFLMVSATRNHVLYPMTKLHSKHLREPSAPAS